MPYDSKDMGPKDTPMGPGGDREPDVDVYGETFGAAADEAYEAVKRGDAAGFRTALKEAIMACMDM